MEQSPAVMAWWTALSAVSVFNVAAWAAVALKVRRLRQRGGGGHDREGKETAGELEERLWRRDQLVLSALFVAGCAFRSFLPRAEAQRICLLDGWLSSAAIGRAVATVAELAFVAQFTSVLRRLAQGNPGCGSRVALSFAALLLPAIAFAEVCSWYTALTTNFLGSVIEESTWALSATLMTWGLFLVRGRYRGAQRRFINASMAVGVAYVVFMCTVDVPMYWQRWRLDQERRQVYLSLTEGWSDAQHRRVVTRRWEDWRQEIPWMSLYFSVGVWVSIGLVRAPLRASPAQRR